MLRTEFGLAAHKANALPFLLALRPYLNFLSEAKGAGLGEIKAIISFSQ